MTDWEVIVVDDGSTDTTAAVAAAWAEVEPRIKVFSNPGRGQSQALNFGFQQASGQYIKFLDGDDLISPFLSEHIDEIISQDATFHDLEIVDDHLRRINVLCLTSKCAEIGFANFLKKIAPIPRGAWTISRRIGERLFPVPETIPFPHGDVWFALVIKKNAQTMGYCGHPLYRYRQHAGQSYRGIYNFANDVVQRRAKAMLKIVSFIETQGVFLWESEPEGKQIISTLKLYYEFLGKDPIGLREIMKAPLPCLRRLKILVIRKFPGIASRVSRWKSGLHFRFLH
jgi:glycosyltransferase involved in cell wall biosynthesis